MKTILLKGMTEQHADEMRQMFAASAHVRNRVIEVLREKIATNNKNTRSKESYGIANWAFLQADAVGYERALTECISLLTHDTGERSEPLGERIDQHPKRRGRPKKVLSTVLTDIS